MKSEYKAPVSRKLATEIFGNNASFDHKFQFKVAYAMEAKMIPIDIVEYFKSGVELKVSDWDNRFYKTANVYTTAAISSRSLESDVYGLQIADAAVLDLDQRVSGIRGELMASLAMANFQISRASVDPLVAEILQALDIQIERLRNSLTKVSGLNSNAVFGRANQPLELATRHFNTEVNRKIPIWKRELTNFFYGSFVEPPGNSAPLREDSNTIVTLDHNSVEVIELLSKLDELVEELRKSNQLGLDAHEEKERAQAEIVAGRALLKPETVRVSAFKTVAIPSLKWIREKVASATVEELLKGIFALIEHLF